MPAVGLGAEDELEYEACGARKKTRVSRTEEAIEIVNTFLETDFEGGRHTGRVKKLG